MDFLGVAMALLILGLVLFVGVHWIPTQPDFRQSLIVKLGGPWPYRAVFSVISLAGFIMLCVGYGQGRGGEALWQAPEYGVALARGGMPLVMILLMAAYIPSYVKKWTGHPMNIAVILWGLLHLVNNGDVASILLFGSFVVYAIVDTLMARPRDRILPEVGTGGVISNGLVLVLGVGLSFGLAMVHGMLFGVSVIG